MMRRADRVAADQVDVPQVLIIGKYDAMWAPPGLSYYETARSRGDDVEMIEAVESGHFEMVDPSTSTWPLVVDTARRMLGMEPPSAAKKR